MCLDDSCCLLRVLTSSVRPCARNRLPLDEFSELMAPVESSRPASIFSSFEMEGADVTWTRAGVSFIPTTSAVKIKYSTHSVSTHAPPPAHRKR